MNTTRHPPRKALGGRIPRIFDRRVTQRDRIHRCLNATVLVKGSAQYAMLYGFLAGLLVAVHLTFVGFVVFGGIMVRRWPRLAWVHLPVAVWGIGIEWSGAICPLTPWENWLRLKAGQAGYEGDFIEHYFLPVLYPAELTRSGQIVLGAVALGINLAAYGWLWHRSRQGQRCA